jgi:hypothetical protein
MPRGRPRKVAIAPESSAPSVSLPLDKIGEDVVEKSTVILSTEDLNAEEEMAKKRLRMEKASKLETSSTSIEEEMDSPGANILNVVRLHGIAKEVATPFQITEIEQNAIALVSEGVNIIARNLIGEAVLRSKRKRERYCEASSVVSSKGRPLKSPDEGVIGYQNDVHVVSVEDFIFTHNNNI